MKEERRRQKQLEANFEEEYFEDHGGRRTIQACINCGCFPVRSYIFVSHLSSSVVKDIGYDMILFL